jgi:hypothetical protein
MFVTNLHFKTTHVYAKVRRRCYKFTIQQLDILVELVVLGAQQYVEFVLVHKGSVTRSQQCPQLQCSQPMHVHVCIV